MRSRRGPINDLSAKSAKRLMLRIRNGPPLKVMVTLTYPGKYPSDGRIVKRDLGCFTTWLYKQGYQGVWVLEFQERGAPHFHIFLTKRIDKDLVAKRWYDIVGSNDPRHLKAGTYVRGLRRPSSAAWYAAKYVKHNQQKQVPPQFTNVGRMWGVIGGYKEVPVVEVTGTIKQLAPTTRILVRHKQAQYRNRGRRWHDNGIVGFTGWNSSNIAMRIVGGAASQATNPTDQTA